MEDIASPKSRVELFSRVTRRKAMWSWNNEIFILSGKLVSMSDAKVSEMISAGKS